MEGCDHDAQIEWAGAGCRATTVALDLLREQLSRRVVTRLGLHRHMQTLMDMRHSVGTFLSASNQESTGPSSLPSAQAKESWGRTGKYPSTCELPRLRDGNGVEVGDDFGARSPNSFDIQTFICSAFSS